MERIQTASTVRFNSSHSTINPVTDSLIGTVVGSAGAVLAFVMRLILGNARSETRLLILRAHGELKAKIDQEFRQLEHRLTRLETEIARNGQ